MQHKTYNRNLLIAIATLKNIPIEKITKIFRITQQRAWQITIKTIRIYCKEYYKENDGLSFYKNYKNRIISQLFTKINICK
jgi:fructose-1,6-bisphosphatase